MHEFTLKLYHTFIHDMVSNLPRLISFKDEVPAWAPLMPQPLPSYTFPSSPTIKL